MPPLSQSRPKRAAAEATAEKILSSLKEERATPGERDPAAASATTAQPSKRQKRAAPSSAVKVEKVQQKEVTTNTAAQSAADAAPKSTPKAAAPTAATPVHLKSITRSLSVEEASKMAEQLAKEQAEQTRKMAEAEKAVRAAKKALKDAEGAKDAVQVSISALADKMSGAVRDRRTDIERVMDVIVRAPRYTSSSTLADAFDDLLTLQANTAKIDSAAQTFVDSGHSFRTRAYVLQQVLVRKTQPRLLAATAIILGSFRGPEFERASIDANEWLELVDAAVLVAPISSAASEPIVDELIRRGKQPPTKAAGHTLIETCPIHKFVYPTWEKMRSVPELATSAARLASAIRAELEASVSNPIPAAPDYAMPEEAALVGSRDVNLRDFLLSNQTALTINASKAGRMAVHRLIDGLRLTGKLSHESEGCGHGRALVVRKRAVNTPQDIAHMSDLKVAHRKLLAAMPRRVGGALDVD